MRVTLLEREIHPNVVWAIITLAFAWLGNLIQSGVLLNHDVSWIGHSARWWLRGATFGTDILDPSPPMAWILSLPAAVIAESRLLDEPAAIRLTFWIYFGVCTGLLLQATRFLRKDDTETSAALMGAFIVAATLVAGFSFGQREYLSALFAMPYLACSVVRLQGERSIPSTMCVVIGVIAGIGFAIKPFFLAVPLLVEFYLAVRRGWRILFRPEALAIAITVFLYGAGTLLLMPEYVRMALPLVTTTYWAYDTQDLHFLLGRYRSAIEPALFAAAMAALSRTWTHQHSVLTLAIAGYSMSYFVQSKGFIYHAYPVTFCSIVLIGVALAGGAKRLSKNRAPAGQLLRRVLTAALVVLTLLPAKHIHDDVVRWYFLHNVATGSLGAFRNSVIETVRLLAPSQGSYFFAFSTHPFPGFPTASYTEAEWTGRAASQFLIPAFVRKNEIKDSKLRTQIARIADIQRRMVIEDFDRRPPTLVFVERSTSRLGLGVHPFDDIAFYLEESRFRQIWARYEELRPLGSLRIFRLKQDFQ
jgi:uncharacterized membrane protein